MHNSFILQQYVCYITILTMSQAAPWIILGRTNCITIASGNVTLCKQRTVCRLRAAAYCIMHTVRMLTESDNTRCCNNTICPPEDEQRAARNMLRIVV